MSFRIPRVFSEDAQAIGPVLCVLRPSAQRILGYRCLWVLLLACTFAVGFFGYKTFVAPPRNATDRQAVFEFACYFGGVLILAIVGILYYHNKVRGKLLIGENGFAVWTPRGGEAVMLWEQLEEFRYQVLNRSKGLMNRAPLHQFKIVPRKGAEVTVHSDDFSDLEVFSNALDDALHRHQFPKDLEDFQNGDEIDFGPVVVTEEGVRLGALLLEWEGAREVKLSNGVLMVRRPDGWISWSWLPLGEMPNVSVFIALVNRIAKDKRSRG